MQQPVTGDRSTAIPSPRPSQASFDASLYYARRCITEDPSWSLVTVPHLTELCLQHIVHNFEKNPILNYLLPKHQRKVLDRLSTGLPLAVTANLVSDEEYWKRCCTERWQLCDVSNYGDSWKRMFFERHLENILKCFTPNTTDPKQVLELIPLCKGYVRKLEIDQFLPPVKVDQKEERDDLSDAGSDFESGEASVQHYDLKDLITALPHLEELHLTYGVKDCGMNFEWNLFNFTNQDCCNLAAAVKMCHNLKVFKLTRSNVDDEKTKILARNLLDHPCLVELNLSHNLIRDKGAQALGKLISRSKLETLDLCNNQIHHLGAQALAQALAEKSTLTSLNLRLNCVEDKGGEAIGHALLTNTTLKSIHLGSNNLSEATAAVFSQVLAQNTTLRSINFSCNQLGLDGGKQLLEGLADNKTLTELDLRQTEVDQEAEYLIHQIVWANREAVRLQHTTTKPP
ncbi:dynein regulatory complex subunit 5 [Empidonax traillii]|uniref:dynein regulatory complex subunit 5 n=1 Tax=Empidonax traillii TaxID=164674 RepID=UPI000FFCFCEC|nr:dynein regulatory complex subunit 5 [Empidonax traillii]XP_027743489.1 dynein regulatory complex subunit 5 [Empidonax traillii]XP_027743490.1 dynein regulatory complex subunit 5 [Empidonax traillii]XP_027743491.1 dynein regulatory complex subunit 5 [Empidonax traillii]XP_027743492.1 dynein regulatory complex subunit 5 [Empidonax traillii]XP_027743493.1 dynein regulatory complex subunit 5 [Empidonax traillii]